MDTSGYGAAIAAIIPCTSIQATRRRRRGLATFAIKQGSDDSIGLLRSVYSHSPGPYLLSVHSAAVVPMAKEALAVKPMVSARKGQDRSRLYALAVLRHAVFHHVLL